MESENGHGLSIDGALEKDGVVLSGNMGYGSQGLLIWFTIM